MHGICGMDYKYTPKIYISCISCQNLNKMNCNWEWMLFGKFNSVSSQSMNYSNHKIFELLNTVL